VDVAEPDCALVESPPQLLSPVPISTPPGSELPLCGDEEVCAGDEPGDVELCVAPAWPDWDELPESLLVSPYPGGSPMAWDNAAPGSVSALGVLFTEVLVVLKPQSPTWPPTVVDVAV
jgi:hypothetical protein